MIFLGSRNSGFSNFEGYLVMLQKYYILNEKLVNKFYDYNKLTCNMTATGNLQFRNGSQEVGFGLNDSI